MIKQIHKRFPNINDSKTKILIVSALCLGTIILFYFYASSNSDSTDKSPPAVPVTEVSLNKDIDSIISTFGIKKIWVKELSSKDKDKKINETDFWISKEILIPNDLPVIELNYEITNYLANKNFIEKVTEDSKTKNLAIDIFLSKGGNRMQVGNLKLIYSDTVNRDAAEVCIILDSIDSYSLLELENFLNSNENFSFILPLRNDKADFQSMILDAKKDYLLKFLIGNENEVTADFKSDMKESVWKSKVKSLAINFGQAAGIILISSPGLNQFTDEVEQEFLKNNLPVYKDTLFTNYKPGVQNVISLFEDIISKSKSGKKILIYIINFDRDDFLCYDKNVYTLKKLGYKFYDFKNIINRMN